MQAQDRPGSTDRWNERAASRDQLEALVLLELVRHPELTNHICHLAWEVRAEEVEVEAAVGRLQAARLVGRRGDAVFPTQAARRYNELWAISSGHA